MVRHVETKDGFPAEPQSNEMLQARSLEMVPLPTGARRIVIPLLIFAALVVVALAFVPWRQTITGRGRMMIYSPMDRPQNLESQIPGRIRRWYVKDGMDVKEGDVIVTLDEVDPNFLDPKMEEHLVNQQSALLLKREAIESRVKALQKQISCVKNSRQAAVPAAEERYKQAGDRITAAEQAVKAAERSVLTADWNLTRRQTLYDKGLRSKRDLELAQLDQAVASAELQRAQAQLQVAQKDQTVTNFQYSQTEADTGAGVQSIEVAIAQSKETLASIQADIQSIDVQVAAIHRRVEQRTLRAPATGRVVRLLKAGAGETVAAGAILALIAPKTEDLAAALIVSGNDAPLILPGSPVRLQFAGWPAVQFTGWPSVAVGTFAGLVAAVDQVDDGKGNFRVIVVPDPEMVREKKDQPWPSSRFLRPGSEVSGWVILKVVPLGYELWRQFNAFPPTIDRPEPGESEQDTGKEGPTIKRKTK